MFLGEAETDLVKRLQPEQLASSLRPAFWWLALALGIAWALYRRERGSRD